jgi:hypothetical protein
MVKRASSVPPKLISPVTLNEVEEAASATCRKISSAPDLRAISAATSAAILAVLEKSVGTRILFMGIN